MGQQNPRVSAPGKDGDTGMYVRCGPLGSIGELGYLLYNKNKPWTTIRLFGPDPDNTTALFNILSIIPTNKVYQGFVNPNSQDAGSLACAFFNASKGYYPGDTTKGVVNWTEANALANRVIALGMKGSGYTKAYTNIADICRLQASDIAAGSDFWRKKAIMRNSIGLLNPRQNYWLVLVCAQAVKTTGGVHTDYNKNTDFVTAEVQCLAYIWRDPYEDPTDTVHAAGSRRHKMFVQFFKWL